MDTMRVSHNEILLTSQKVFEGLGHHVGTYQDAAESIAWLELHGISALQSAYADIAQLRGPLCSPLFHTQEGNDPNEPSILVNLNENHLLFAGPLLVDYLATHISKNGHVSASVLGVQSGLSLLPILSQCAQRGIGIRARWSSCDTARDGYWTHVSYRAEAGYPRLTTGQVSNKARDGVVTEELTDIQGLHLQLSQTSSSTEEQRLPRALHTDRKYPLWFWHQRGKNLAEGIEIETPLWQAWTTLAKAVLVEATEASRQRGAGEQAS